MIGAPRFLKEAVCAEDFVMVDMSQHHRCVGGFSHSLLPLAPAHSNFVSTPQYRVGQLDEAEAAQTQTPTPFLVSAAMNSHIGPSLTDLKAVVRIH